MKDNRILIVAMGVMAVLMLSCLMATGGEDVDADSQTGALYSLVLEPNYTQDNESSSPDATTHYVKKGNQVQLPGLEFTMEGYILTEWYDKANDKVVHTGDYYTVDANTTLYAKWTPVSGTHLEAADAVIEVGEPWEYTVEDATIWTDDVTTVTFSGDVPTNLEWKRSAPDTEVGSDFIFTYNGGKPGTYYIHASWLSTTSTVNYWWTITVIAEMDKRMHFTYDYDGGSNQTLAQGFDLRGGTATILASQSVTTKTGYELRGWNIIDGAGGNIPTYALGSVYTAGYDVYDAVGSEVTVTASWAPAANIMILNASGAEGFYVDIVREGDVVTLYTAEQADYDKPGYTLEGWYMGTYSDVIYTTGYQYRIGSASSGAVYANAYWVLEGTSMHTITYNSNGGNDYQLTQKIEDGRSAVTPTHGYTTSTQTLIGWSTDPDAVEPTYLPGHSFEPSGDVILYAVYGAGGTDTGETYSVTFNTNGGTGSFPSQQLTAGSLVTEPANKPARAGYVFLGWSLAGSTGLWDFGSSTVQGNMVLNANWREHFTLTISGTTATLRIDPYWTSMGYSTIDWGDGQIDDNILTQTSVHTYQEDASGTVTVTTHRTGTTTVYESSRTFNLSNGGGTSTELKAMGSVTDNKDGTWTLSAQGSTGYDSMKWTVNETEVGTTSTVTLTDLADGRYDVTLTVTADDTSKTWTHTFYVGHVPKDDDHAIIYIAAGVLVAIMLIFFVRSRL